MLEVDKNKLPKHVAIIMDGNGRWAKKRGKIRTFGHRSAIKAVRSVIESSYEFKIPYLTLYAFSTENWKRPQLEIKTLMLLLVSIIKKETKNLLEKNFKVITIGNTSSLPNSVQKELNIIMELTKDNTGTTLILALNYGGKEELIRATKLIIREVLNNQLNIDEINENLFENYLYTKGIPSVDLLIRTSGEHRISNFLLWQVAYAEFYFTEILWPDFTREEFVKSLQYYQSRERRFGKISEQLNMS